MTNISVINNIQILKMYDKLIEAFEKSNTTVEEFSKITGISVNAIERALCKNISNDFTSVDIVKLAKYLGIKIKELF